MDVPDSRICYMGWIGKRCMVKHIADTRISLYAMRCDTGIVEVDKRCQKETLVHRQKGQQSIKKKRDG